ncbi:MAG TPA: hypothetical protein VFV75_04040 [Candidatus Polarisedimenticolaceae bacterium]|nr:hypothetical protein [Candidatus Polarisedimenticolaceae bacterium]
MKISRAATLAVALSCFAVTVAEAASARVIVKSVRLTDNGDNDGFADPNETVSLYVTLRNVDTVAHDGIAVALVSVDAGVDCTVAPVVAFGSLAAKETREAATPLVFHVANLARTDPDVGPTAVLDFLIWGDDFDLPVEPQRVTLELDLDVSGGGLPTSFTEGFEGAGFGSFTTMTLDVGQATASLSQPLVCQYHTCSHASCPELELYCYVGFPNVADNAFDWHVHGAASPDGGRAYLGSSSLHWGVHPGPAGMDTTRLKQLDAIRTTDPINLGWNGVTSELRFKHQVGLVDCDYVDCPGGETVDRGVVHLQVATSAGTGIGVWKKLYPYENLYDSQAVDNYTNCTFDPKDDGSTWYDEDPSVPVGDLRHGPSSTCNPEFSFDRQGAIAYDAIFNPADIGHATDGPGLQGTKGPGTWVESKFSLAAWRGRRVRLRFLATSIEVQNYVTMQQIFFWNPMEADDGWYIDDVLVTHTLTSPATIAVDAVDRTGLPDCGASCTSLTAVLTATPGAPTTPGEPVVLDASASSADLCPGGPLLYRFWQDVDFDGEIDVRSDVVVRSWTDDPTLTVYPPETSRYAVEVRCSAKPTCTALTALNVALPCPTPWTPFPSTLLPEDYDSGQRWDDTRLVDVLRGDLGALRASAGQFDGTVQTCLADDDWLFHLTDGVTPAAGTGFYYLVRLGGLAPACERSWGTGSPAERPGTGGDRDADISLDPDSCD